MRKASHAGSWYSSDASNLNDQLQTWMNSVSSTIDFKPKAIIAPHAGYTYSGLTAAYGYSILQKERQIKRIFILGPSHREYFEDCALSSQNVYETPLGNLNLDLEVISDLHKTGLFSYMSSEVDEVEHSIELHLPFIRISSDRNDLKIVPILCGHVPKTKQHKYGKVFSHYLQDPECFFIISSDFCHWGPRFDYYYLPPDSENNPIHKRIENMDKEAIQLISSLDTNGFHAYISKTKNTICGRIPIGIFLATLEEATLEKKMKFLKYDQSNNVKDKNESSVSYASIIIGFAL